ncbi:MAG: sulfatase-like hydrolase/transferase, partial [Verrucomicrobiales bacterium]|nr:sulfatase-like hydrolase/transferase [Verrucomicrobiales bacterium]
EGGIRIPYIVSWPGHVAGGRTDDRQVSTLDVVPTAAALAGATLPADRSYDGINLIPYLTGVQAGLPHPVLYWRAGVNYAIRDGSWKMWIANRAPASVKVKPLTDSFRVDKRVQPPADANAKIGAEGQVVMLYDLSKDIGETKNLAVSQSAVVDRLRKKLNSWDAIMESPQWASERQSYYYYRGEVLQLFD